MGLSDVFKRIQVAQSSPILSLSGFTSYYLYGFTQNPNHAAPDQQSFGELYQVDLSTLFGEVNVWPDTRLTYDENPLFSTYAPFVIPFLVDSENRGIRWDAEITQGVAQTGHASAYVERVTKALRFFMAEPAFVIGFDEFDEKNPSGLIDNFIKCKQWLSGH